MNWVGTLVTALIVGAFAFLGALKAGVVQAGDFWWTEAFVVAVGLIWKWLATKFPDQAPPPG